MAFFGLDIGSYTIKLVQAKGSGDKAKIEKVAVVNNPVGSALPADSAQFVALSAAIEELVAGQGLVGSSCHLALPSQDSYISVIEMPNLSDTELSSAINWEAEQHIPVNLSEVNYEYDVIYRPEKNSGEESMLVLLVGAGKQTVARMVELMERAQVEVVGLEPEILSLTRAFVGDEVVGNEVTSLYCNLGSISTVMGVMERGRLRVIHTASVGSLAVTRALERGLGLSAQQAEEYKRTYGLDEEQLEGKVSGVIAPVFDSVVAEVKKTLAFYVSKSPATNRVSRVVVSGGGSLLPGVVGYLARALSVEVVIGDPFSRFSLSSESLVPVDGAAWGVAVGLAVKKFEE